MISYFVGSCFCPCAFKLYPVGWDVNRNPKGCNFWNGSKAAWLMLCFIWVLFLIIMTWVKNTWDVCTVHEIARILGFSLSKLDKPSIFSLAAVFLLSFLCELVLLWKKSCILLHYATKPGCLDKLICNSFQKAVTSWIRVNFKCMKLKVTLETTVERFWGLYLVFLSPPSPFFLSVPFFNFSLYLYFSFSFIFCSYQNEFQSSIQYTQ